MRYLSPPSREPPCCPSPAVYLGAVAKPSLYGGMPSAHGPPGMAPRLLEFADELRREGVAVGTSELLDAFGALDAVSWT